MELTAYIREKSVKKIRGEKKIPAILYGHKVENISLEVDYAEFEKIYKEAGESTLISLKINNQARNVLIYGIQREPLTGKFFHIDFYQVRMNEKIKISAPLVFVGESLAIKDLGGILVRNLHEVEIEALPQDLLHEIEVDISPIKTFDGHIYIRDLRVLDKVKILAESDEIVASVVAPRTEEELAALEEKPEEKIEEVEMVEKKKKEGEEEIESLEKEEKK